MVLAQTGASRPPAVLQGGGDLGKRMREMDWSTTALGPPDGWPQSLKTAVRIMLTSRQPIWIGWGPELTYLYNDPYRAILGGKHPWALGKPTSTVWREIWADIAPLLATATQGVEGTYVEEQLLIMERNGYREETYYTFSYSPIPDDHGDVGGIICANTEDTRRVIGERQLALLRELAARTPEAKTWSEACDCALAALALNRHDLPFTALYVADAGTLRRMGTTGLAGEHPCAPAQLAMDAVSPWPVGECLRTHQPRIVPASGPDLPTGAWKEPPTNVALLPLQAGEGGRQGILMVGLNPFRLVEGEYLSFLGLVAGQVSAGIANADAYDEERRRASALAELDRAKTTFFSNVSHEFRTPLTLMLGPVEDILAKPADEVRPANRELLEVVHRNGQRLLKLVNNLLDFSRIEAGRVQARLEPVELGAFTAELASVFRAAIEKAGMRLVLDCPPVPRPVYVDRDMWEKVVMNLLSNAFKYTLAGEIRVTLRPAPGPAGQVELTVADTGTGIPESEVPKVFQRFHRVEGARGRTQEGTGIGLALVQELVRLHGGDVRLESRFGEGTTFFVTLPYGRPAPDGAAAAAAPAAQVPGSPKPHLAATRSYVEEALRWLPDPLEAAGGGGAAAGAGATALAAQSVPPPGERARPVVVLADDNADMRAYVARLLGQEYDVAPVADGGEALQAVRDLRPDLLVTDAMMPVMDGFAVLREVRGDPALAGTPIIMLSARAGEEARIEGIQAGADDYVTKPFSAREFMARVSGTLALAKARAEAAEALRESEARFRHLANNAPVMVWVTETDGQCTFVSDSWCAFTGQSQEEALGTGWVDAIHPDDRSKAFADFMAASRSAAPFRTEYRLRRGDGTHRWALAAAAPRRAGDGGFLGYIGSVIDITDRKDAEDALADAARRKDEFLAMLGHELRNPLAPIATSVQVMRMRPVEDPIVRASIATIERQSANLSRLVDDLLDVARITRGRIELRRRRTDLNDVLGQAVEAARPLMEARRHDLSVNLSAGPAWVDGDPVRLAQVFTNLLNNAAKYTEPGGRIRVGSRIHDARVEVRVTDTGIGIPAELLGHVFDLFTQGAQALDRAQGGLGLGLTIVRNLVEMHGGTVEVASEGPGRGSTFTVSLPLLPGSGSAPPITPQASPETVASGPHPSPRIRILVVDDNLDSAESLALMLELEGHTVQAVHDGHKALAAVREFRPDVVLLDLGLPGLDGLEVARRIRGDPSLRQPHLVAVTGYGQEEDRRRSAAAGFDQHLTKPLDVDLLGRVLARA